jgi:hypothetical protein
MGGDCRWSENTQTQHIEAYNTIYEVQVKVITYWVTFIRVYKRWSPKDSFKGYLRVLRKWFNSHGQAHTLHPRREWASSDELHLRAPVGNLALIGLDLPLTALISIVKRRWKILTSTQTRYNKSKAWVTMLSKTYPSWPQIHETRHAKASKVIRTQSY